jgi:hypothetical protein
MIPNGMSTEKEVHSDILAILAKIQIDFPELIKYLPEMPIRNIDIHQTRGVSTHSLSEYYHSLESLVNKYAEDHSAL